MQARKSRIFYVCFESDLQSLHPLAHQYPGVSWLIALLLRVCFLFHSPTWHLLTKMLFSPSQQDVSFQRFLSSTNKPILFLILIITRTGPHQKDSRLTVPKGNE